MDRWSYLLTLAVTGCTADAAMPMAPPAYRVIAGEYAATVSGRVDGLEVGGSFTLSLTQARDTIAGRYQLHLTLANGASSVDIRHRGALEGTVEEGERPAVRFRIENDECPRYFMRFEGRYDPDVRQLAATGAVDAINTANGLCHLAVRLMTTLTFREVREASSATLALPHPVPRHATQSDRSREAGDLVAP